MNQKQPSIDELNRHIHLLNRSLRTVIAELTDGPTCDGERELSEKRLTNALVKLADWTMK